MRTSSCLSSAFVDCLRHGDLAGLRTIPKADLHNHAVLGGSRDYIFRKAGVMLPSLKGGLDSMQAMHRWVESNVFARLHREVCRQRSCESAPRATADGRDLPDTAGGRPLPDTAVRTPGRVDALANTCESQVRALLIEATFSQAERDGVALLEVGEDVWARDTLYGGAVEQVIGVFETARARLSPGTRLRLQIGISRHCSVDSILRWAEPFWEREEFYSLDLSGDESAQPIANFVPVYDIARGRGLRLKAHVGEWGSADDVLEAVSVLGLHVVQHGIAAVNSHTVMTYLRDNSIRLNMCPTSNLRLGRVNSLAEHPIGRLFRAGIDVTIGSDDLLVFGSDVSREFMRLYKHGVLSAEELDTVRISGLKDPVDGAATTMT